MTDKTARGRFVWHDLMTSDPTAAQAFYGKALGWTVQPFENDPDYKMFASANGPLGGTGAWGGQAHWIPYIGATNAEEAVNKAKSLGATVTKDITQIPNGASYVVLTDPQGATFGIYAEAAGTDPGPEKDAKRGEFSWHDLGTTDAKAAVDFYQAVFGWELLGQHDMGPEMGLYYLIGRNGKQRGGVFKKPAQMPVSMWTGYVRVKDVNQAVKKVKSAGGVLINGPMEVPGGDWIAQFADPHGAIFAVHTLKADLTKPAAPAEAPAAPAAAPAKPAKAAAPAKKAAPAAAKKSVPRKPAKKKPAAKARSKAKAAKKPAKKASKVAKKSVKKVAKKKSRSGGKKKSGKKARKAK